MGLATPAAATQQREQLRQQQPESEAITQLSSLLGGTALAYLPRPPFLPAWPLHSSMPPLLPAPPRLQATALRWHHPRCSSSPTGLPAATIIGRNVTIGQGCLLRSTTVEDEAVVGDKCVLLEGSLVEKNAGEAALQSMQGVCRLWMDQWVGGRMGWGVRGGCGWVGGWADGVGGGGGRGLEATVGAAKAAGRKHLLASPLTGQLQAGPGTLCSL